MPEGHDSSAEDTADAEWSADLRDAWAIGDGEGDHDDASRDAQIVATAEMLKDVSEIRPEEWQELTADERLGALQKVEGRLADIQGRTPIDLRAETMGAAQFGYYQNGEIALNAEMLRDGDRLMECLDTILHETRHAFQHHAAETAGVVSEERQVEWSENFEDYKDVELFGQEAYARQPVEADAADFARAVLDLHSATDPILLAMLR